MSDDGRDLRKYTRRSAIGLMGVGGGLAATETLGFTNLTAGRGVELDVTDDLNGTIGIEVKNDTSETLNSDDTFNTEIEVQFTNQGESQLDLTVEVSNKGSDVEVNQNINGNGTDNATVNNIDTDEGPGNLLKVENTDDSDTPEEQDFSLSIEGTFDDGTTIKADRQNITLDTQK